MATKACIQRLSKDLLDIRKEPVPFVTAVSPEKDDMTKMHFVIEGPTDTPYEGGQYWGTLVFPHNFPWSAPSVTLITPNGRFAAGKNICMSITNFHQVTLQQAKTFVSSPPLLPLQETWNPMWGIRAILLGLISFMCEDSVAAGTVAMSEMERKDLAAKSWCWNAKQKQFLSMFEKHVDLEKGKRLQIRVRKEVKAANQQMLLLVLFGLVCLICYFIYTKL